MKDAKTIIINRAEEDFHDLGSQWQRRKRHFDAYSKDPFMAEDLYRFVLGDKISSGTFRDVYEYGLTKGFVVKVAEAQPSSNIIEMEIWDKAKDQWYAKWFAPCVRISPNGHFLIQKRARPITNKDKLPKEIPQFFTDLKKDNFGFIGKQLVCLDYQFILRALDYSMMGKRKLSWE